MPGSDKIITLSYSIKESQLEAEVSRLYTQVLEDIVSLGVEAPRSPEYTLTYQSLDSLATLRDKAADINRQLANVQNIVTQFLEHKANTVAEQPQQNTAQPTDNDEVSMIMSPYEQQRRLAQEIQKNNENTNQRHKK